jgi:multidrug efflux pump subunit AcrA (membrane-fusion protein)
VSVISELTGRTTASLSAEVRPQVGGIIQKRLFTEGDMVKAGRRCIKSTRPAIARPITKPPPR